MKHLSRVLIHTLIAAVAFAGTLTAQTNSGNQRFSIIISPVKAVVPLGSDIDIAIKLTNTSVEPIVFNFSGGAVPGAYWYDVRDDKGAGLAKPGRRNACSSNGECIPLPARAPGNLRSGQLKPGESTTQLGRLSQIYEFDRPGKYTIQVSRNVSDVKGEEEKVYSNTITITVLPPDPPAEEPK